MSDKAHDAMQTDRLARWVREHGRAIVGFAYALLRDRHAADDVVQEVFCKAWQSRGRYAETGQERAYLLKIADRLVCDRRRRSKRELQMADDGWQAIEPADMPADVLVERETQRHLHVAMEMLTEPQRRTLLLRYFGQLEFHEIAEQLGTSINTVLSHNRRGLLALRGLLTEKRP